MDVFGFCAADYEDNCVDVWPDNWLSVQVFMDLSTQWRIGMGGAYGLDYAALNAVCEMRGIGRKKRNRLFDDIREMESVAVGLMQKD